MVEVACTSRSAAFEIRNGHPYRSPAPHRIELDGRPVLTTDLNVFVLHELQPATEYRLRVGAHELAFRTESESAHLDVRAFGAVGDGCADDTAALQSAIDACPTGGLVEIPEGTWLSGPLFLKSQMALRLARGACLKGLQIIERWPLLPAFESGEVLGSWEGQPAACHAGLLTGVRLQNVRIFGEGSIDANASFETWWSRPKQPFGGWRPRTVYLVRSQDVSIMGLKLRNSPSWTVHMLRCADIRLAGLDIEAPADSPNTDGINPESSRNVYIAGARISTGDDCVGIKSGKRSPDLREFPPSSAITISNCLMESGHGAVVIGSETSGGVSDILARDCVFRRTDRGLRIKTRRGRGRMAIVERVKLQNVRMEDVGTPFVVNSFYWCDPDGREPHVGDRRPRPIDEGTPSVRDIQLIDVDCDQVHQCAGFVLGLPEMPLQRLHIERYRVRFAENAVPGEPDMAEGITPAAKRGFYLCNVREVSLNDLTVDGVVGPAIIRENAE